MEVKIKSGVAQNSEDLIKLSQLIDLAKADNQLKKCEYELLLEIATHLKIDNQTFQELIDSKTLMAKLDCPLEHVRQFHRLIQIMNVDSEVHHLEIQRLTVMGLVLGMKPTLVSRLLNEMHDHKDGVIPLERLIKVSDLKNS